MTVSTRSLSQAFIGMGANLDDPIQQIVDARSQLAAWNSSASSRCSSLYSSSPVGYDDQPDFINCVLELHTTATAHQLLTFMQSIEESLGRVRSSVNRNAPRRIDLDLLLFANENHRSEVLEVPHPRMAERLFVLTPLAELGVSITASAEVDFSTQVLHKLEC